MYFQIVYHTFDKQFGDIPQIAQASSAKQLHVIYELSILLDLESLEGFAEFSFSDFTVNRSRRKNREGVAVKQIHAPLLCN